MKRHMDTSISKLLYRVIALLLLGMVVSLITYRVWISGADHRDFYPLWAGARRVIEGEREIYSVEATKAMQVRLYGAEIPESRDQQGFAYPAIVLPFLLPFALIDDVEIATAIWEGLTVILLVISLYVLQKNSGNDVSFLPILLLILWSYTQLMVFQGQTTGLVLFSLSVGYWAHYRRADFIAGLILSIGFVKPELVILPIASLVILAIKKRRFRMPLGVVAGFSALFAISLMLVGWWVPDWLATLSRYAEYAQVVWPVGFLWSISPILLVGLSTLVVWGSVKLDWQEDVFFAAMVPLQLLLFPQTLLWGLSMLCLPLMFAWNRKARLGVLAMWALGWVLLILNVNSEWWKVQFVTVALCTLFLLFLTLAPWARKPKDAELSKR